MAWSPYFEISVIFLILGAVLVVWRLLHKFYLGEFWNNTPTPITWGATIVCAGIAMASYGTALALEGCPYDCDRVNGMQAGEILWFGLIVFVVGVILAYCPCCSRDADIPVIYNWTTNEDNRGAMSGLDFAVLGIGLSTIVALSRAGDCPNSCAQAVHVR